MENDKETQIPKFKAYKQIDRLMQPSYYDYTKYAADWRQISARQ